MSEDSENTPNEPNAEPVPETPKPTEKGKKGFKRGMSGHPAGRPKGSRNKATMAAEQLLDGEAETITRMVIELAKEKNPMALRMCMERILSPRKGRPVCVKLPEIGGAMDIVKAHAAVLAAASSGDISLEEAALLAALIDGCRRAIETEELAKEVEELKLALKVT